MPAGIRSRDCVGSIRTQHPYDIVIYPEVTTDQDILAFLPDAPTRDQQQQPSRAVTATAHHNLYYISYANNDVIDW